jgi:hypothetical protein
MSSILRLGGYFVARRNKHGKPGVRDQESGDDEPDRVCGC